MIASWHSNQPWDINFSYSRSSVTILPWELSAHRSRHRKARVKIGEEPAGVILDLLDPESNSGVLAIQDETSGEWT